MMRFAEKGDFPAVRALWETCFPDEGGFNDYFFAHFYKEKYTLLYLEGETLVAMVQMLPYRMTVGGVSREVTYIYGACTDPAHRRKGYMARLLERSFELDREAGRIASVLIPAEKWLFDFYKPFGYEPFFHISRREITRAAGEREAPRRLTSADVPALAALYDKLVPKCRIERDTAYWNAQLALFDTLGAGVYGWFEDETLTGYAFCWEDNAQELLGADDAQMQGLLQTLGRGTLTVTEIGAETALGVCKWHEKADETAGYMNLMLN